MPAQSTTTAHNGTSLSLAVRNVNITASSSTKQHTQLNGCYNRHKIPSRHIYALCQKTDTHQSHDMKVNESPSNSELERPLVAFYPLKPSGHLIYLQVNHSIILCSAHTVYMCVLCGPENKQRLFPYTP
jgi:hypothetical protein